MKIQLSDHFTYPRLLKFTMPSIVMMIFTSIYGVVDGLFVSNVVGSNALSSISIIMPLIIVIGAFGFMLGTGGSAEVSKTLGEGKRQTANEYFTMIILTIIIIGVVLSAACAIFIRPLSYLLGASELLIDDCAIYGGILSLGTFAFMLQTTFQSFFIAAEKPKLGLFFTVVSGITNIVLDWLFICVLRMGIAGAALGTVCSYLVGGVLPIIYFIRKNSSLLHFTRPKFYPRALLRSCSNGSSEMVSNISAAVITYLYNKTLMDIAGEDGVAAYTALMYINMIFIAILIGFSIGTAPVISFNYGAQNHAELHNLFKKCMTFVCITSVAMTLLAETLAVPIITAFIGHTSSLFDMTLNAFRLYSTSFLLCGFNIFASSFFTSLCNGGISATISFLRTLVLQAGLILLLPQLIGINGVWLSVTAAELLTLFLSAAFLITQRKKYHY